jgi:DNA-directed RNA polymerase subunit RPC12/RpoP
MANPIGREVSPGHRLVGASMLPDIITECPHCGCKNFSLVGDFNRPFEQIYVEGLPREPKENSIILAPQAIKNVEGIVCPQCNIHTIIEDDMVFERENLIFDLHTQIAILQGKVGTSPEKDWVN